MLLTTQSYLNALTESYLNNLTKEERFLFLRNEMTYDPMYQETMDIAWHHACNIEGHVEALRKRDKR